ncbi:ComF family protein, partial [Candidatus Kaiserbacteria bacterium]|nr:ComF family protein [Candidatus Kaiserbacteria bacterium]
MHQLLTALINALFPPTPEHRLVLETKPAAMRALYHPGRLQNIEFISRYTEPVIRAAITENKFHRRAEASALLSVLLEQWLENKTEKLVFIPIPLGVNRMRERGYNQVERILNAAHSRPHTLRNQLTRPRETEPQTELNRTARLQNMHGAFVWTGTTAELADYDTVVLLDDVV